MGLTVGLALNGMTSQEKKAAYACDITYGTNNEMGFDYLRDNMVTYKERKVQRGHAYAMWTRWTPSSSTKPAPPSSSPARGPGR